MKATRSVLALGLTWLALGLCPLGRCQDVPLPKKTALDDYVAATDPSYSWKLVKTIPGDGVTTFVVDLKSQRWRKPPEVDRSLWEHWLVIVKPDQVKYGTALMLVGGGRNGNAAPDRPSSQSVALARNSRSVVAELSMVPNQPLILNKDGKPRTEDDLIAYCWNRYMDTGDATWIPRLAMVKSVVRAMDTLTELLGSAEGGKTSVKKFVVAGGSKRGWTTWLTGAVDPRVVAIIPIVIDVVNVRACSTHHYSAYGFWAPALGDYTHHKIFERSDTPQYGDLLRIEDPYFYRHRLTLPKFILNASGDQYFPPDSSQYYFNDLAGVKYLRYVPNANHSLKGSDAVESLLAFYQAILKGDALPRFSWDRQKNGALRVRAETTPREVNLWQATNAKARDFRLEAIGAAYKKSTLTSRGDGTYVARLDKPASGWTAYFAELVFENGSSAPYKFTTQVYVVPDTFPHSLDELRSKSK